MFPICLCFLLIWSGTGLGENFDNSVIINSPLNDAIHRTSVRHFVRRATNSCAVAGSAVINLQCKGSTITGSKVHNGKIFDSTIEASTVFESQVRGSTVTGSAVSANSNIVGSKIINSKVENSKLTNCVVTGASVQGQTWNCGGGTTDGSSSSK